MHDAGAGARRVTLDSIQKVRAGKNARDAAANSIVETAAALPRPLIKRQRRLDVCRRHRTAIRAAREICEDLRCAGRVIQIPTRQTSTRGALRRDTADTRAGMAHKET